MTTYYLVRHGEPDWELNEIHRLKGQSRDLPALTPLGIEQAKQTAKDERFKEAELIVCSPYTRAMQTAAIISKETGLDMHVEFDLREWQPDLSFNFDNLETLKQLTDDFERHNGVYPEGVTCQWESKEMMKNRIEGVLSKYSRYSKVVVVGHGMIFRTQIDETDIPHCSVFELRK